MSERGRPLRLGTRASALATSQSEWVADRLRAVGHQVDLVLVQTYGDRSSAPLAQIGGTGVFVSALREALQEGEIDFAVHSLKDLPVGEEVGLVVAAVPEREDPRDVLISRGGTSLSALSAGAVIGTGSPRRAVQLAAAAPQVRITGIRGNVGSRIDKVATGEVDAVVLAAAGLRRLGRFGEASQVLDTTVMLPAPGQGALAVECRSDDRAMTSILGALDHPQTRAAVAAERALLGGLEAGCSAPVGALATYDGGDLVLDAVAGAAFDRPELAMAGANAAAGGILRHQLRGSSAVELGHEMAHYFLSRLVAGDVTVPDSPRSTTPGA